MEINSISTYTPFKIETDNNNLKAQSTDKSNFSDFLNSAIDKVNQLQIDSSNIAKDFAVGKTDNIHQVMISGEKAELALQFTMQIRNKILDAYNEIMRMQI